MDKFGWLLAAAAAALFLFRFRHAYRKSRINQDKGLEIQRKLAELRKKRDEE